MLHYPRYGELTTDGKEFLPRRRIKFPYGDGVCACAYGVFDGHVQEVSTGANLLELQRHRRRNRRARCPPPASVLTRDKDIKRNCHTETTTNTITQVGCDPFNCTTKHNVGVLKHTVRIFVMLPTINVLLTVV